MNVKVLGSSGAELPGYNSPAFLVDGTVLLDAGTIGTSLGESKQWEVRHILITHSHLDHIKAIPFLADNIVIKQRKHSVTLYGTKETLKILRDNLLNDKLWPDFTKISASIDPVLKMKTIVSGRPFIVNGYSATAYPVSHTVPAVGYVLRNGLGRTLLYTGDTGPTQKIWASSDRAHVMIIEVSFPNSMEELAIKTGHLTPDLLGLEIDKMKHRPEKILITHIKPHYMAKIEKELRETKNKKQVAIQIMKDGRTYEV
ncbi:MAG: 3',5'-cyclic-nucleotide phosphodiesterase [Nitrospirota bacterium]|nr:3',5'-cyclic-nucleotide phosphodiesterase [Nitrospirota bacterium]